MKLDRGENWEEARSKALIRDCNKCIFCNREDNLQVHHIIPYSISKCNRLFNLATLCPVCHRKEENWFIQFKQPSIRIRRWKKDNDIVG